MNSFINFFAIIITAFVFALWLLPAYMMYHISDKSITGWGILYLPIVLITFCWGGILYKKYFK